MTGFFKDYVEGLMDEKKGRIYHYGFWEYGGLIISKLFYGMVIMIYDELFV